MDHWTNERLINLATVFFFWRWADVTISDSLLSTLLQRPVTVVFERNAKLKHKLGPWHITRRCACARSWLHQGVLQSVWRTPGSYQRQQKLTSQRSQYHRKSMAIPAELNTCFVIWLLVEMQQLLTVLSSLAEAWQQAQLLIYWMSSGLTEVCVNCNVHRVTCVKSDICVVYHVCCLSCVLTVMCIVCHIYCLIYIDCHVYWMSCVCQEFEELWPHLDLICAGGSMSCTPLSRVGSTVVNLSKEGLFTIIRPGRWRLASIVYLFPSCCVLSSSSCCLISMLIMFMSGLCSLNHCDMMCVFVCSVHVNTQCPSSGSMVWKRSWKQPLDTFHKLGQRKV